MTTSPTKPRGRPRKTKIDFETFNQAIEKMMIEEKKVNWEELAKKQENQMQVLRNENEDLAKICVDRWEKIQDKEKIIKYLEGRIEDLTIRSR
jgi:PHP family Zn ribbon phosphoesterase